MSVLDGKKVLVIGAGMAGSEAAYYLARHGVSVVLLESKRLTQNPAQKTKAFAELVCTNSLKSLGENSGHGLLKTEMEALGSLIIQAAKKHAVPAGDALAVDREKFSQEITDTLSQHPLIQVVDEVVINPLESQKKWGCDYTVIASGPLTLEGLTSWIQEELAKDDFYFYDAIAPVVDADSLDYSKLYFKDRYGEVSEGADYLNAPMNKEEYENFIRELVAAHKVPAKNFEDYRFFEGCLPIDTMAERGLDTPRFSCMKPVGLELPTGKMPWAVVQLRKENLLGSAYNLVGFQTRLLYKEQERVFRMIPGLEKASFLHFGSVHRNSFLSARKLLNADLSSKKYPHIFFAGQITGVEGYTESASSGLYAAIQILRRIKGLEFKTWPVDTAMGALNNYIMTVPTPTPSNINFGLLPSVQIDKATIKMYKSKKDAKKILAATRARESFQAFLKNLWETP